MADDAGKTEEPTPRRIREARKEGQFPRTPDAAIWLGIAAGFALVPTTVQLSLTSLREMFSQLTVVIARPTTEGAMAVVSHLPWTVLWLSLPVCAAASLGSLLGWVSQGVFVSGKALKPKFKRMNPKDGIKRMFGVKAIWEAVKALIKVVAISAVLYLLGTGLIATLAGSGRMPLAVTVETTQTGLRTIIYSAVIVGLVLGLFDYGYQYHTVMKQLKMTMREVRDEMKQTEGDPLIKGAIRAKQMAMSRNRMLSAVVDADVVLVNPTHIAVALKYERGKGAPRVVAKGAGAIAAKIREKAREARVPVVEDKPLARTLYRVCEVDEEIPAELYLAVAKILAFVMAAGKPSRTAQPRKPSGSSDIPDDLPSRTQLRVRRNAEIRAAKRASNEGPARSTPA